MRDMKPLIVKASRHHDQSIADRQFSIEQSDYEPGDFGKKYVCFSGYFGEAGPHVFAAAPELLEALELLMKYSARPSCESLHHDKKYRHTALEPCPVEANLYQARIMAEDAIAKAKGKTE